MVAVGATSSLDHAKSVQLAIECLYRGGLHRFAVDHSPPQAFRFGGGSSTRKDMSWWLVRNDGE